jgi:hypothetical protein
MGELETHTPPLFLARTCSIVLSLCRGDELEKDRISSRTLVVRLPASTFAFNAHCVFFNAAFRNAGTGFALGADTKVRRAEDRAGSRSTGASLRVLDAPATQLHADDMSIAVKGTKGGVVEV